MNSDSDDGVEIEEDEEGEEVKEVAKDAVVKPEEAPPAWPEGAVVKPEVKPEEEEEEEEEEADRYATTRSPAPQNLHPHDRPAPLVHINSARAIHTK